MTTTTGDMVAYLKDRARQHKTRWGRDAVA